MQFIVWRVPFPDFKLFDFNRDKSVRICVITVENCSLVNCMSNMKTKKGKKQNETKTKENKYIPSVVIKIRTIIYRRYVSVTFFDIVHNGTVSSSNNMVLSTEITSLYTSLVCKTSILT